MNVYGLVSNLITSLSPLTDSSKQVTRVNAYGELPLSPEYLNRAIDGSLFITSNPTVGTAVGVSANAQATYSATTPSFLIRNTDFVKSLEIRRVTLSCVTAAVGNISYEVIAVSDVTNRLTTGGARRFPVNAKASVANNSSALIYDASTAITASAASAFAVTVGRGKIRTGIPNAGDVYILLFGNDSFTELGSTTGATALKISVSMSPFIVPPGGTGLIHFWGGAQTTAPTFEYTIEHYER